MPLMTYGARVGSSCLHVPIFFRWSLRLLQLVFMSFIVLGCVDLMIATVGGSFVVFFPAAPEHRRIFALLRHPTSERLPPKGNLVPGYSVYVAMASYAVSRVAYADMLLRGTIVNRTYGTHENLRVYLFLLTKFGPIYYGPP